jgi:thiamine transporter 2/3
MIALIPIFILTDFLLYKPTMLLEILGQIGFRASLVFFSSVFSQIIGTISYAVASASEIGFFAYAYGRLEKDQYRT